MTWYEINQKDWDKLSEENREIFLTPICGRPKNTTNSLRFTFAGRKHAIEKQNIKSLREINEGEE